MLRDILTVVRWRTVAVAALWYVGVLPALVWCGWHFVVTPFGMKDLLVSQAMAGTWCFVLLYAGATK